MTEKQIIKDRIKIKLKNISTLYNIDELIDFNVDNEYIKEYYKLNKIPYSIVHSKQGFVHFAVNKNGRYDQRGMCFQPDFIIKHINKDKTKKVLELACGRGANLVYLATRFPEINFEGVDLSKGQLDYAYKKTKKYNNLKIISGDFHDLSMYKDDQFDLIYIIEALCYSTNKRKVFNEVKRVLKKEGLFIIFDGYWREHDEELVGEEKILKRLAELGMALNEFEKYSQIKKYAEEVGYELIFEEDLSNFLIPNANRFGRLSDIVFENHFLRFILRYLLPQKISYNSFFGYLVEDSLKMKWTKYVVSVFKK